MNTFNYLLGFGGYSQKVMITFKKDGELDPIAVQKAIGEAGFVRDDWHPTIEEYAEFLCRYVAVQCDCQYSCAWSDFATDLHIAWADSEAACEECPAKPYCPNYERVEEDSDEYDCCEDCDGDCDNCTCEGCHDCYADDSDVFCVGLAFDNGKIVATIECYGNGAIDREMVAEAANAAAATIKHNKVLYTHEGFANAMAKAISALCGCDTFVNFAEYTMSFESIKVD